jgi:hypothetical protein
MEDIAVVRQEIHTVRGMLVDAERRLAQLTDLIDAEGMIVPRQGLWTRAQLDQIRSVVSDNPGLSALFDLLSQRPDQRLTFSQVLEYAGRSDSEMRSDLRQLSRATSRMFGSKTWPFEADQGPIAPSGRAEMLYRMSSTIAGWWR